MSKTTIRHFNPWTQPAWTAALFMVGSALFAAGVPIASSSLGADVAGWTFFVGSIFFTSAGLLQFLAARQAFFTERRQEPDRLVSRLRLRAGNLDWLSAAIQSLGTLLFNVNTFRAATILVPTSGAVVRDIWRPDAVGSILFLVSSGIAFLPEVRRHRHGHRRDRSWAIAGLNLLGSVFFGVSAIGAFTNSSGALVNESWANGGTFWGAVCFFLGASLQLFSCLTERRSGVAT